MKKWLSLLLCVALLLSLTACTGDFGYARGMKLLREGNIAEAYAQFRASTDTRAPGMLRKFAWVPVSVEENRKNYDYYTEYTYDAAGNPIKMVHTIKPSGDTERITTAVYTYVDGVKRIEQVTTNSTYNDNKMYVYDAKGNLTYSNITDEDGNVVEETFNVYDGKGNLLVSDFKYISKFEGEVSELYDRSEYSYDEKGRVTAIVRNENVYAGTQSVTTYTYAEDGSYVEQEKRIETGASLGILAYERQTNYDEKGRIVRQYYKSESEMLDEYTYDEKGNKTYSYHKVNDRATTGSYVYDEKDRLLEMKQLDNQGTIKGWEKYTYDEKGRPLTENISHDGIAWEKTTYVYDEDGRLMTKSITDGNNKHETITYQYNEDGTVKMEERVGSEGTTVIAYGYDEWGNMVSSLNQTTPAGGNRIETGASVSRELYYYPNGVPEDITTWLDEILWE